MDIATQVNRFTRYIQVRSGLLHTLSAKFQAAEFMVDSNQNYDLRFNKNGTIVTMIDDGGVAGARAPREVSYALVGNTIHAGVVGFVNPYGVDVIVSNCRVVIATIASAAGKLDVGLTTVSITTASDTLADGLDMHSGTAPLVVGQAAQAGANGVIPGYWPAGKWVTVSDDATGNLSGLVGTLYLSITKV